MSHVIAEIILTNNKHPFLLFQRETLVVVSLGFFLTFCGLWTGLFQNKRGKRLHFRYFSFPALLSFRSIRFSNTGLNIS